MPGILLDARSLSPFAGILLKGIPLQKDKVPTSDVGNPMPN